MSKWLDRLRKASKGIPTKPTKPGSVSFVSIPSGHFQNIAPTELPLSLIKEKTRKQQGTDLLALVADLLGTRPALLLEGAYLLECDLVELVDADASQIAYTIRTSPAWINRPQQVGQQIEQIVEEEIELSEIIITAATATPALRRTGARSRLC